MDVEVNKDNGRVIAKHVYGAMDCGLAINPGIVESQIVGMSVHGTSLALREEVQFNQTNVTSLDWNSYQTLRFGEHPAVTPIVVQQLNEKSTGAGEEVLPAVVGGDRQRVLRRHRRETASVPADATSCAGRTEGGNGTRIEVQSSTFRVPGYRVRSGFAGRTAVPSSVSVIACPTGGAPSGRAAKILQPKLTF